MAAMIRLQCATVVCDQGWAAVVLSNGQCRPRGRLLAGSYSRCGRADRTSDARVQVPGIYGRPPAVRQGADILNLRRDGLRDLAGLRGVWRDRGSRGVQRTDG